GGNSGSQAATLITRAIALGQVDIHSLNLRIIAKSLLSGKIEREQFRGLMGNLGTIFRVLRHELLLGVALGLTLGGIGYVRGWLTPEDVRQNPIKRRDAFQVRVPYAQPLGIDAEKRTAQFQAGVIQTIKEQHAGTISWEEGTEVKIDERSQPGYITYDFPE